MSVSALSIFFCRRSISACLFDVSRDVSGYFPSYNSDLLRVFERKGIFFDGGFSKYEASCNIDLFSLCDSVCFLLKRFFLDEIGALASFADLWGLGLLVMERYFFSFFIFYY